MAGTKVATGELIPKIDMPANCKICKREQCLFVCLNFEEYQKYLRERYR